MTETTSWDYDAARWSDRDSRLLGFAGMRSTQGESVAATHYQLTDACGARPDRSSVENTHGKVFSSGDPGFEDPGSAPPYTCLTRRVIERDCEGESLILAPGQTG